MECTDKALDFAVGQSYDHLYGARPLRRWLEHHIITPLSRMIISGEFLFLYPFSELMRLCNVKRGWSTTSSPRCCA